MGPSEIILSGLPGNTIFHCYIISYVLHCKTGNAKSLTCTKLACVGCFESHVPNLRLILNLHSQFRNVSHMIFYAVLSIHFPPCVCLLAALRFRPFVVIKTRIPFSLNCHWFPFVMSGVKILMVWSVFSAVEPPVSDHPKFKDLVVAYGKW